jgi:5-oxoprolinase (ATP-hydrolysing)
MNNITFGNEKVGYYETVGGGAGAGPSWHGRSGVHTHMTNTRITDAEILETRYPIILNKFSLRDNSGGRGKFNGGNGLHRELIFREKMELCILTERRVFAPYGLNGGKSGAKGKNTIVRKDGLHVNLGSKSAIRVEPGVSLFIFLLC